MFVSEIIGNLGSDAVIKDFGGKKYVSMNVAHSTSKKNQDGTRTESTQWISALWYGEGGNLLQYLKRGVKVFVRGRTYVKTFQRQDGTWDSGVNIDVTEIQLCGSKNDQSTNAGTTAGASAQQPAPAQKADDDLPF